MTDDDLHARLARRDPVRRPDVAAYLARPADPWELAMNAVENDLARPRPVLATLAVAASLAVVVGGAVLAARPSGPGAPAPAPTTLALSVPDPLAMSSCVMFDVDFLKDMPVAFAGTATAVSDGSVTLTVDHWYRGGDAGVVTVTTPSGDTVALDGAVAFEQGGHYLVTATDGVVNGCGFSGPATAELESAFEEAFGAG